MDLYNVNIPLTDIKVTKFSNNTMHSPTPDPVQFSSEKKNKYPIVHPFCTLSKITE